MAGTQPTADYYRYCPGEERIRISNAICRGRRHAHFPKCHGCQFNDDERSRAAATTMQADSTAGEATPRVAIPTERAASAPAAAALDAVFRWHDVLGKYPQPLNLDAAWRIGYATARFLFGRLRGFDRADPNVRKLIVGRDARESGGALEPALIEGIQSAGLDVVRIGIVDSPQVHFAVHHLNACGGIHVTGGRRPADYNGFRICAARACPVASETGLPSIRDMAARAARHETGATGAVHDVKIIDAYREYLLRAFRAAPTDAAPHRVVIAACAGVATTLIPAIFGGVRYLNFTFLDSDADGVGDPSEPAVISRMRKAIRELKADFGVAFDGSATACVFADDKGTILPADHVAALVARRMIEREPGASIVHDHRFGRSFLEEVQRAGGTAVPSTGSGVAIKKCMHERRAVFGADFEGRFYFDDDDGPCSENAFLALWHVADLLCAHRRRLSDLVRPFQRYRSSGGLRFRCGDVQRVLNEVAAEHVDARIDRFDGVSVHYPDWWFNVRPAKVPDELELVLEARNKKTVEERLAQLTPLLGDRA